MKKNKVKIILILVTILGAISIGINTYAHSGRTDSSGGHKDNNNKSGLGNYHYHCGGHPAHLHTNGICPYSSSSSSSKTSSSSSSSSSKKTTTKVEPSTIKVTGIQINENIENLDIGNSRKLTATITPSNATDKSITWKSSDENIAKVTSTGEIIAKNSGIVEITATSSNGKTSTIKINIKEEKKAEDNNIVQNSNTSNNNKINTNSDTNNTVINSTTNNKEDSNPISTIAILGVLGGGGYWGYKKYRK